MMQKSQTQNLVEVHSAADVASPLFGGEHPVHLLLHSDSAEVLTAVRELYSSDTIYSISVFSVTDAVKDLANAMDTVPVFVVSTVDEAHDIVNQLQADPFSTVESALNGEAVSFRYLEGNPT